MKILITGSNGLLGQKLIKLLLEKKDIQIIASSRGENRLPQKQAYDYFSMDVCNKEEVNQLLKNQRPDVIIHTAAMTNVDDCEIKKDECQDLNVNSVKYLLEACATYNIFLLHLSTDFIFDGKEGPYTEEAKENPLSHYGETKLRAEELIKKSDIKWAIARTVLVYGITEGMSRSNIILWVKDSLEKGKELKIVNDQWRTPTLAEDLAEGCWLIAKNKVEGVFNISGNDLLSPYDMAMKTCDFFKLNKELITEVDGSVFSQKAKRPAKTGFVIEKAKTVLGYNPHSFEEGIKVVQQQLSEM